MNNEKIKILVCHHKKAPYIKNECIIPIQVGKSLKNFSLDYCVGDDTGVNISKKNPYWCELTALYWAWKNLDADYYGLMHYRRYLSFTDNEDYQVVSSLKEEIVQKSVSPQHLQDFCSDTDIITGPIWNIHPIGLDSLLMTSYEFYAKEHIQSDMDVMLSVIEKKFPEYYFAALDELSSTSCFFMNLMVLKKDFFYRYCEFIFGVLEEIEKQIDIANKDAYQKRVFGFLAERLSNIFVKYCKQENPAIRIKHTGMFFLAEKNDIDIPSLDKQILANEQIKDKSRDTNEDTINICMSFDDNYLKPALTTIVSILYHTNAKINFYFLCDNRLSSSSRDAVNKNMNSTSCAFFIDVDNRLLNYLPLNRSYISVNTYYRLLIDTLISVDKIIYIDSDVLVVNDIRELWNTSLDCCIAGVLDEGGVMQSRRLSLGASSNYVNAGVLIFNLKEIRKTFSSPLKKYFKAYYQYRKLITLQDQDILNIVFKDNIKVLPLKWNMNSRIFEINELDHKYTNADIQEALGDLGIIHFTDRRKPWKFHATHPLKCWYWYYRKKVYGLPMSIQEKRNIFLQNNIKYHLNGNEALLRIGKISISVNKKRLKSLLRFLKFKF